MRNPTRQNLLLTLAHPHPAAPLPPPLSLCPPPARLTRLTPHTPAAHPAYTLHPRSLRPSSLRPAGNGDSTMQSLHSAITAPCNHLLRPTRQLPNKSKSRQVEKPTSWQVGERPAPWLPARPLYRSHFIPPCTRLNPPAAEHHQGWGRAVKNSAPPCSTAKTSHSLQYFLPAPPRRS